MATMPWEEDDTHVCETCAHLIEARVGLGFAKNSSTRYIDICVWEHDVDGSPSAEVITTYIGECPHYEKES